MNPLKAPRQLRRTSLAAGILGLSLILAAGMPAITPTPAAAQDHGPAQRVIKGKVEDKSGAAIKGAIVYLRDGRSTQVKSAISTDDGSYRFVQLSQGVDYDLWAQIDQKKSKTKSISSFDSKNEFTITLTIDK